MGCADFPAPLENGVTPSYSVQTNIYCIVSFSYKRLLAHIFYCVNFEGRLVELLGKERPHLSCHRLRFNPFQLK